MGKVVNLDDRRKEKKCNTIDDVTYSFDTESYDLDQFDQSYITVAEHQHSSFDKVIDLLSLIDAVNDEIEYLIENGSVSKFEVSQEKERINIYIYPTQPAEYIDLNIIVKKDDE